VVLRFILLKSGARSTLDTDPIPQLHLDVATAILKNFVSKQGQEMLQVSLVMNDRFYSLPRAVT